MYIPPKFKRPDVRYLRTLKYGLATASASSESEPLSNAPTTSTSKNVPMIPIAMSSRVRFVLALAWLWSCPMITTLGAKNPPRQPVCLVRNECHSQ